MTSTPFKLYPITGGEALLVEDVSEVDARRAELSARQERLKRANALLVRDREVKHRAQRQKADRALSSKTRRIEKLLAGMPEKSGAAERAERRETLMEVKLLVAYCKRKGGLVIAQECDPDFDRERLQLAFNETASNLCSLDIDCAALVETSQILPAAAASMLYDCLYDFAAAAFSTKDPVLMLFVRDAGPQAVEFRAALETTGARTPRDEALRHMKARVHDTIGQRLSILHRYLEDDDAEEKGLSQVIALLRSIVDDLASPEDPSSAEDRALELASIKSAFSLVGIALEVTGGLPSDEAVAQAFVQVIREASTNAAKHAQAQRITVALSERDGTARRWRAIPRSPAPRKAYSREPPRSPTWRSTSCDWSARRRRARKSPKSCTCRRAR